MLEKKGEHATRTTCNCFCLLNENGIPTHFLEQVDPNTFLALKAEMFPLEVVARRIATGSILNRRPELIEGTIFDELVIELFLKDDERDDPLAKYNPQKEYFELFDAKTEKYIGEASEGLLLPSSEEIKTIINYQKEVFVILERAWGTLNVVLVDLKCEYGRTAESKIVLADVIDNDSWRIWPEGKKR